MKTLILLLVLTFGMGYWGWGQVNISAGSTITENFVIGTSATATLPSGWKADKNTTARSVGSYSAAGTATELRAGNNMSSTAGNGIYNFGAGEATTSTERAVGGLSSGTASKSVNIFLHLINNGTSAINDFTISYSVEKYRDGTNPAGFSIQMFFSADGIAWTTAGPDFLTSFPGSDPTNNGYPAAPGVTTNVTGKTLSAMLASGSGLYLAWNYSVTSGTTTTNAQALGIDNVSITANGGSAPATYTWNQNGTAAWTTSTNWTPDRTIPQVNDILQVTIGGTCNITGVPIQTIGQLIISNNTTANLQSDAAVALTIGGGTGTDLDVHAGCALNLNGDNAISIAVGTGATGSIGGNMTSSSTVATANRLTAVDPGSIIFTYGGTFTAGTFSSGNPFGTTSLGSIVFTNGSTFIHQGGDNPFGASPSNSVVAFQPGSLYKVIASVPVSFSGRTYANFESDAAGVSLSPEGENPVSIDNLTVTNGTLNFNMTGTTGHSIKGNIYVATEGILNFAPTPAGTVTLNGTCTQAISGTGPIGGTINSTIEIANSDGVTLNMNLTTNGNLKLTNGLLTLGSSDLVFGTSSTIMGTPSASAMIVATGTGQVKKGFSAPGSFTYPIGDHTAIAEYSPVTLNFTSGIFETGNFAGVNLVNAKYPTDPNTGNYLNRYWAVTANAISSFSCNALFQYVPADVSGTEGQIHCVKVDPVPFITYGVTDPILHQLTAGGLTSFGSFTGTEAAPTIYEVAGTGTYCQGDPGLPVTLSGSQVNVNYQLKKNGIDHGSPVAGTGSPLTWTNQMAGTYTVVGTNSMGNTLMNGSAVIEEIPSVAAVVSIVANANPVCEGTMVAFTATASNGGTTPAYQWKVNGVNFGTNDPFYTFVPVNGDQVLCTLTSSEACTTGNPATSNTVTIMTNPTLPVSVIIAPSVNPVCPNTPVTFTATPVNGGTNPHYQWKVNGVNTGTNTRTYSYTLANNDAVTCVLTSSLLCTQQNPVISNTVNMVVNEILPVSVSIGASANPVCVGTSVTFTATPVNGGTNPVYQWKVNGVNVGTSSPLYTYVPANSDHVLCIMTSNLQCVSCNPAISGIFIMTVNTGVLKNTTVGGTVGANKDTSFSATELITVAGGASTFLVQGNGWATMFAGENILYMPGTKVEQGGYMRGNITSSGLYCGMLPPSFITVIDDETSYVIKKPSFVVYPNPTTGIFIMEQKGGKEYGKVKVELFGMHGESLMTAELTGEKRHRFSLSEAPPGLYFLRVFTGENIESIKIMKH